MDTPAPALVASRWRHVLAVMRPRVLAAILALAALSGGCRGGAGQPPPGGTPNAPARPPEAAPSTPLAPPTATAAVVTMAVGERTYALVDRGRATDPGARGGPPTPGRTLLTVVYYPAGGAPARAPRAGAPLAPGGPFPIILFSHGLRGQPGDYVALLSRWAGAGAVVIAPTYPLTSRGAAQIVAGDLVNQPADASFVLSSVLQQASEPGDPFHGRLDAEHVIAAGHSEGALTTIGLFSGCCRDSRLKGGIILAGDDVGFRRDGLAGAAVPLLFLHGDADPLVPYALGRAAFARVGWPKAFVTLLGATHITPYLGDDPPAFAVVGSVTTDFVRWIARGDAADLAVLRHDADVPGVARLDDHLGP